MAFKQQPLLQEHFKMKIIKDLGKTTANENTTALARYALFECTTCLKHFKARASGSTAKNQTQCQHCTRSPAQEYKHPLYAIWNGIKQRCYSKKRKDYPRYGGLGVTMCAEWKNNSSAFIQWCLANGWNSDLVVDKDIKCREDHISPAIYSPDTISFITNQMNTKEAHCYKIEQYSLDMKYIATHDSGPEAAEAIGVPSGNPITSCCRGTSKTSYGFIWKRK